MGLLIFLGSLFCSIYPYVCFFCQYHAVLITVALQYCLISNWLKDLNIRPDTIKCLEEIIHKTFSNRNHTKVFLGQSLKAVEIKTKINRCDLIKIISFCIAKETIDKRKDSV